MEDIHDIKPLLSVDFPWLSALVALGLMMGLILLGAWLIRRLLRRKPQKATVTMPAAVPKTNARDQALRALNALRPDPAQTGPFYLQLERVLKEFLEHLNQAPVTGYTSSQLLTFLQQQAHPSLQEAQIEQLLMHGQQAKFASLSLSTEQMQQDLERAVRFVKKYTL
jgi:hypothetical protein